MTAADKIAEARALIEPLTDFTPGPWRLEAAETFGDRVTYRYQEVWSEGLDIIAEESYRAHGDGGRENMRLIAAAPALRDTVAALADLADALAQENAKLKAIIAAMDGAAPLADKTCDEPGITLSEAVQREWPQLRLSPTPSPETAP